MDQENQDFVQGEEGINKPKDAPADLKDNITKAFEKFKEFPPKMQFMIIGGVVFFLLIVFSGGDKESRKPPVKRTAAQQNVTTTKASSVNREAKEDSFTQISPERETLQRGFFEEQRRIIADRLGSVENKVDTKMEEVKEIQESIAQQAKQLNQMIENFNEQMKAMEQVNKGSLEEIRKLAEESKNRNLQSQGLRGSAPGQPAGTSRGSAGPKSGRDKPIRQIILQHDGAANTTMGKPLLGGIVQSGQDALNNTGTGGTVTRAGAYIEDPAPFVPPLGFIRGTLLNGFDALAGAGTPTPALVRLSGSYKTAMNSTVNLNGCFMLIEFEGDLSTERAFGTPARMTCVYPDQGAVTYDVAGYVVDEKDGIVGVPGIFYEGDPSRIAAAMIADFTAAISDVVKSNQSTSTTDSAGTAQSTLTGSETKAELAGGISNAVGNLRDYLTERANRIVPFVRVDSTRDLHIVILEGVELRQQGKPWTLLVSGKSADSVAAKRRQVQRQATQKRN